MPTPAESGGTGGPELVGIRSGRSRQPGAARPGAHRRDRLHRARMRAHGGRNTRRTRRGAQVRERMLDNPYHNWAHVVDVVQVRARSIPFLIRRPPFFFGKRGRKRQDTGLCWHSPFSSLFPSPAPWAWPCSASSLATPPRPALSPSPIPRFPLSLVFSHPLSEPTPPPPTAATPPPHSPPKTSAPVHSPASPPQPPSLRVRLFRLDYGPCLVLPTALGPSRACTASSPSCPRPPRAAPAVATAAAAAAALRSGRVSPSPPPADGAAAFAGHGRGRRLGARAARSPRTLPRRPLPRHRAPGGVP